MAVPIEMRIHLGGLRELHERYPRVTAEETAKVMDLIVRRLEDEVVADTPRGVGGAAGLAGSIHGEVAKIGNEVQGLVGTPLEYGIVVELGRSPNRAMPPIEPIRLWAERKLGVPSDESRSAAFAIAKHIAVHGFEGAHMFGKAFERLEPWILDMLRSIANRVAGRLNSG